MRKIRSRNLFGWLGEEEILIKKFEEEKGEYLVQGSVDELEAAVDEFCMTKSVMNKDRVYEALLPDAVCEGTLEILQFVVDRVISLPFLEEVDMDVIRNVEIPAIEDIDRNEIIIKNSPFMTEEPSAIGICLESPYVDMSSQRIMWTDGEKLFFMDATPMAAAVATGNMELLQKMAERNENGKGFYGDDTSEYSWIGFRKSKQEWIEFMAEEILNENTCRLWSPEEAVLLSGNLEMMKNVFDSQEHGELIKRLGCCALEHDGTFFYKPVHKCQLPDAFYWLNEKASIYMDENYPELWEDYNLDKIIASANYVFLTRYLNNHEEIKVRMLESLIDQVDQVTLPLMTFGMLEDKVSLTGIHCIPISRNWLEKRKCLCRKNMKAFLHGKRGILMGEEDLEEDWCAADEAYMLGSFLKAMREENIPGWEDEKYQDDYSCDETDEDYGYEGYEDGEMEEDGYEGYEDGDMDEDYEYENDDENSEWRNFGNEEMDSYDVIEEKNDWADFWESSYEE